MESVTGDAPQPGETPREEANPWAFSDADTGFWRGQPDRDAAPETAAAKSATLKAPAVTDEDKYTGEAAGALAAGRQDTADKFADAVPDVMILPEPNRNRPTVALDRGGPPRFGQAPPRPPSPLLESSPFWLTEEQRAAWPQAENRDKIVPSHRQHAPRRPAPGLAGLLVLGLVAAFFAWVSAEPFWLAIGHGQNGVATVTQCTGGGLTQRCTGQFRANGGKYAATSVTLLGVTPSRRMPGVSSPARMVSSTSRQAYVGQAGWLIQLRWVLGFLLVLLSGLGIARLTGARRLENARARRGGLLMSLTGPALLLAGFLYVAY
jgi:hypothetical protein